MHPNIRKLLAPAIAAAIWMPCSAQAGTTPDAPSVDTKPGIEGAPWGKNVAITFGKDTYTLASDGIPNHPRPPKYLLPKQGVVVPESPADLYAGDDPTLPQNYSFTLPRHPTKKAHATRTGFGPIGVLVSGAALFNPYEGDGKTVALQHNFTVNGVSFIDACNAHPTPPGGPNGLAYHYHGVPHCITDALDKPKQHSKLIGVALDGFPIYGPLGKDGAKPSQLDECNGHAEPTGEFPQGIYHYHVTEDFPYTVRCLAGDAPSLASQPAAIIQ
ncbi:YHYH protein [Methylococcus sp. ANG]|uniref:YHYH protein n=1 Tax=Methylococcus sp. ANG TaxID=3231903 RepID=UPI0034576FCA